MIVCIRDPDPGPGLFFFLSLCCFCIVSVQELVQIIIVSAVPPHARGGLTLDKTRQQDRLLHTYSQWTTSPLDDSRRQHALLRPTHHGRLMTSAPRWRRLVGALSGSLHISTTANRARRRRRLRAAAAKA